MLWPDLSGRPMGVLGADYELYLLPNPLNNRFGRWHDTVCAAPSSFEDARHLIGHDMSSFGTKGSEGTRSMSRESTFGSDERSDAELLQACLVGDQRAWSALVERYHRLIFSIGLRQGLTADDSADLVQNVFTIILRRLETIQDRDRFPPWLITIAKREAWRIQSRNLPSDGLDEVELVADQPLPEEEVMAWERATLVRVAVDRLNDTCRKLILALFFEQRTVSYIELAEQLHLSVGSIGPTRARCFRKLAAELVAVGVIDSAVAVPEQGEPEMAADVVERRPRPRNHS